MNFPLKKSLILSILVIFINSNLVHTTFFSCYDNSFPVSLTESSLACSKKSDICTFKSLMNLLRYCFCFMFWLLGHVACGILAPQPGIKPTLPGWEGKVLTNGPLGNPPRVIYFRQRSLISLFSMPLKILNGSLRVSQVAQWKEPACQCRRCDFDP